MNAPVTVDAVPARRGRTADPPSATASICIVSHNGYGAISGRGAGFVGGVESQTSRLAVWLADRGHRVSFLTWHEGGPDEEWIGRVRVIKICRPRAGLPGLRFFHPKWTSLHAALGRADADVCYHNCGECVTGQIALWCRTHGRRFVFALASNADCDPRLPEMRAFHEKRLYALGLESADRVIAQTEWQRQRLAGHWRVRSSVVPMPCSSPGVPRRRDTVPPRVLWVGRICPVKRLEFLLDVAAMEPGWHFDLVGPLDESAYSARVAARAADLANVTLHGRVPKDQVGEFYHKCGVLCCTSAYEGFPNTFLEAWSRGVPVVSTFDPDGVIARAGLGLVAQDRPGVRDGIRRLLTDGDFHAKCSGQAHRYVSSHHDPEIVMPRLEREILEAIR